MTELPDKTAHPKVDRIYCADCEKLLPTLPAESIDQIVTDPPYGWNFMGKDWDKALVPKKVWAECLRVLKPGAFAFIMSGPRLDCLSQMAARISDAGFNINFTPIFWVYATGFPKAYNVANGIEGKLTLGKADWSERKRLEGEKLLNDFRFAKRQFEQGYRKPNYQGRERTVNTHYKTPETRAFIGAYGGFSPKPALEVVLVAMKPMSERTHVEQALKNGKGITWLGDARIPPASPQDARLTEQKNRHTDFGSGPRENRVYGADPKPRSEQGNYDATIGRFPANLLVSNSVLDSENTAFSRFFDLDAWWSRKLRELPDSVQTTFPFLVTPKASRTERNQGLESCETKLMARSGGAQQALKAGRNEYLQSHIGFNRISEVKNPHPTIKPLKLMAYLITLGSRPGDIVLDPFLGSGSTCIGAVLLNRHYVGIEINPEYCSIAEKRVKWWEKTRPRWLVHKVV